jgi:hypothetical protein
MSHPLVSEGGSVLAGRGREPPFQCGGVCEPSLSRVSCIPSPMSVEVAMGHPFANGGGHKPPPSHIGMP